MGPLLMAWFPMENQVPGARGRLFRVNGMCRLFRESTSISAWKISSRVLEMAGKSGGKILNPK